MARYPVLRKLLEDTGRFEVRVTEVTGMGHDPDAMKSTGFVATLTRGTEWTATRAVSIPLPEELR